jgi:hypothetical protein
VANYFRTTKLAPKRIQPWVRFCQVTTQTATLLILTPLAALPLGFVQGSPIEDIPMANPFTSFLGKLNPTQLLLGGLSLFGGSNDPFQHRESFSNTGADPVRTLSGALDAIRGLSANLGHRGPTQMRGVVPKGPEPVSVPGLPFRSVEDSEPIPR